MNCMVKDRALSHKPLVYNTVRRPLYRFLCFPALVPPVLLPFSAFDPSPIHFVIMSSHSHHHHKALCKFYTIPNVLPSTCHNEP